MKSIELLAPAKNYEQGRDAVLAGADAVYVGAPRFGARAATGVSLSDIGRLCEFSHLFGVRVYVAMNTLLRDDELRDAEKMATAVAGAGADALIIQDMAFLRMDLTQIDLHSSTQMFNMSVDRARFYKEVGFSRLVAERASTLEEIRAIAATGIEVEAFIHGAICVCHSGRCYMSLTTGRRSGNRGECSQPCRLPYDLLNSDMRPVLKNRHLLSVQDLNLTGHLEKMIDAGVTSFKIEGRLKDTAYVRNTVGWYRQRIDEIIGRRGGMCAHGGADESAGNLPAAGSTSGLQVAKSASASSPQVVGVGSAESPQMTKRGSKVAGVESRPRAGSAACPHPEEGLRRSSAGRSVMDFTPDPAKTFSRGGTSYFIDGRTAGVSSMANPKSTGEYLGRVTGTDRNGFTLDTGAALSPGDGLIFTGPEGIPAGTSVNACSAGRIEPNRMDGIRPGIDIYRNHDHRFIQAVEKARLKRVLPVSGEVDITATTVTLTLRLKDLPTTGGPLDAEACPEAVVTAEGVFDEASNPEKAEETIRTQLSKTGGTIYVLESIDIASDRPRFVPASVLNDLRRRATAELDKKISSSYRRPARQPENPDAPYPLTRLTPEDNVTNRLSERFYRDHGVTDIEPGLDLAGDLTGTRVMQTRYCLRRELGMCELSTRAKEGLKNGTDRKPKAGPGQSPGCVSGKAIPSGGPMFIRNGPHVYELRFDCGDCRMDIIYLGNRATYDREKGGHAAVKRKKYKIKV